MVVQPPGANSFTGSQSCGSGEQIHGLFDYGIGALEN